MEEQSTDNHNRQSDRGELDVGTHGSIFAVWLASSLLALLAAPAAFGNEYRSFDGSGNNRQSPMTNAAHEPLYRGMAPHYSDRMAGMAGDDRPGPREISNAICAQTGSIPNPDGLNDLFWQWGQFIDHDIDLTDATSPEEYAHIPVPAGDEFFDPSHSGTALIMFTRSTYAAGTGEDPSSPREQTNSITGWLDASNVYGSDEARARALRTLDGHGTLKTSPGNLLPFNDAGLPNSGDGPSFFLAGDVRANEQIGLTALHTVFVREHNRLARQISQRRPRWDGERIYQEARALVAAEIQSVTYEEWLPLLLGRHALPKYSGYDPGHDATIANEFSTAAFRFGHSMLNEQLLRLDRHGREIAAGHVPLKHSFFAPGEIVDHGIASVIRGLSRQRAQRLDTEITDAVRNFLFGEPGAGGFDLAARNIQRGRDHGLPSYNEARTYLGFPPAASFSDITRDPAAQARLGAVYASPDAVDLWVGGLAEDRVPGTLVGELFYEILREQFTALMVGDRFFYRNRLNGFQKGLIGNASLAAIIRRNTEIGPELRRDVFHVQ